MRQATEMGMRESRRTIGLVAPQGRIAMAARTVARANMVVESASQSALKLLVKNGVRLAVASAADARGNAEV